MPSTRSEDSAGPERRWTVATCIGEPWAASVLTGEARSAIRQRAEVVDHDLASGGVRDDVRVLVTGWGTAPLTGDVLDRLPSLELVVHAAGSVRALVTDAVWDRGIRVCSAVSANAVPVADFTLALIQLALKNMWRLALGTRDRRRPMPRTGVRGVDGATVGLLGLGHIGRLVAQRLATQRVRVLAYDPYTAPDQAAALGVQLMGLEAVIAGSDVLSLHVPLNDATRHLISAAELALMPPDSTLVNTARGGLIDQEALARFLTDRGDVFALLDVTEPEELPPHHPLLTLDNVLISPHIAGCLGSEEARLGDLAAAEIARFADGEPLWHEVTREQLTHAA